MVGADKICEYETVTTTPPPADPGTGTGTWTFCAREDQTCSFSGTKQVRYGLNGTYATRTATNSIGCNNSVFGDPVPGVDKICEYLDDSSTPPPPPPSGTWTFCAREDQTCSFSGTRQVRYGLNGTYATRTATNSIGCNNSVFGDPVPGVDKICEYLNDSSTPPPPPPTNTGTVAIENAKTGTTAWQLSNPATLGEIEGYASLTSVAKGGSIDFYVNTSAASYNIDIYRMGWYGGAGGRLMLSIPNLTGVAQPKPCLNAGGVIDCNWSVSRTLTIPNTATDPAASDYWASGIYLAKLTTNGATPKDSYIIFVVRDDARVATYIAQLPVTTYQAYNYWGGKSLYTGCINHNSAWQCANGSTPATSVSFNRPYGPSTNPQAAYGVGAGEFITNVQPVVEGYPITSAGFDYNMVRWMERQGYDVKYISNLDLHERGTALANAKAFISMGHDEYYSRTMRDRLVSSRDAGTNLAFFSANQVYWQVRFANSTFGSTTTNRIMTCYRNGGDPVTDPLLRTGKFRDLGLPEGAFLGAQYVADPVMGNVSITNAEHWLFTGSGATNSTVLAGLLGYEVNAIVAGVSPPNVVSLARSTSGGVSSDMTYYIADSTAQVFGTGTMQWSWGLDSFISNSVRSDYTSTIAQKITDNVFRAVAEQDLYTFSNAANSLFLSLPTGSTAAVQVVQNPAPANGSKANQWRMLAYGDGAFQIVSRGSGLCLDAYGSTAGSQVGTWECNGLPHQRWKLTAVGGDSNLFTITDMRSQLCLSAPSTNSGSGAGLVLQACVNSPTQQWRRTGI
ncbi:RICIN domain-containing protein [Noviherbaspirillum humi]|uniref:RICIN domain-containing protein n=1 Tax=Noviherbaspirillum humi TaxID=1688639 RepID=UPI001595F280|nr:RICIN domain-containing protein [Noviherbaspirillum humi]